MRVVEFDVPQGCNFKGAPLLIEKALKGCGLRVSSRATHASRPGSIYWHVKRGMQPGTVEVTLWEAKRRLWAAVPDAPRAAWVEDDLPRMKDAVEAALRTAVA